MKDEESDWTLGQVGRPVGGTGRQDHVATFLADEYFLSVELKVFGQANSLATVIHEDFRFAMHGPPCWRNAWHITMVYATRMASSLASTSPGPLGFARGFGKTGQ